MGQGVRYTPLFPMEEDEPQISMLRQSQQGLRGSVLSLYRKLLATRNKERQSLEKPQSTL